MPTVWNASPYDLSDGAGVSILANTTATLTASDWVTAAILAGLLVIADGDHSATTGRGNPGQVQTVPDLALMPVTATDGKTIPAGSDLPIDATQANRTPILPLARVGAVCGYSKVDNSSHSITPAPHDTDTIIPAGYATLATPQTAVRLFGYLGGWVAVPYNRDAITGAAEFTQPATMQAGATVQNGLTANGGATLYGGTHIAQGATVNGGAAVTGGTSTDTLTVNGATTASGLVTATKGAKITGGLTADTVTSSGWQITNDKYGNPAIVSAGKNAALIAGAAGLYVTNAANSATAPLTADSLTLSGAGWTLGRDQIHNPALLSATGGTGIVSTGNILYVVSAANTLNHANLVANQINADGSIGAGLNLIASGDVHGTVGYFSSIVTGPLQSGQTTTGNIVCGQINASGDIDGALALNITNHGQFGSLDSTYGIGTPANINCKTINNQVPASSRVWKRDVTRVESMLDAVHNARIYHWRYTDEAAEATAEHRYPVDPQEWHVGPMVDDLPTHAIEDNEHGGTVEYFGLIHYAWGAIGELRDELQAAQRENDTMRTELNELRARLDRLESGAA